MSESAAARRRRTRAEAEAQAQAAEAQTEQVEEAEATATVDPMEALAAEAEAAVERGEAAHDGGPTESVESDEEHVAESLIAAASSMFQVAPEVAQGALHHAGVSPNDKATVRDVRKAIDDFLKITV